MGDDHVKVIVENLQVIGSVQAYTKLRLVPLASAPTALLVADSTTHKLALDERTFQCVMRLITGDGFDTTIAFMRTLLLQANRIISAAYNSFVTNTPQPTDNVFVYKPTEIMQQLSDALNLAKGGIDIMSRTTYAYSKQHQIDLISLSNDMHSSRTRTLQLLQPSAPSLFTGTPSIEIGGFFGGVGP
jgi:hypothetical protein